MEFTLSTQSNPDREDSAEEKKEKSKIVSGYPVLLLLSSCIVWIYHHINANYTVMYSVDDKGNRIYTLKKMVLDGAITKSAHPARFSPDDKYVIAHSKLWTDYKILKTKSHLEEEIRITLDTTSGIAKTVVVSLLITCLAKSLGQHVHILKRHLHLYGISMSDSLYGVKGASVVAQHLSIHHHTWHTI